MAAQVPPSSAGPADPALIEDLIAANRILFDQGVLDGSGHVSVRHPRNPDRFLLSRSVAPALTKIDDIIEYDLDCTPIEPRGRTSFIERFIHGEIYKVRRDVNAVVHSHSPTVIPFGVTKGPMKAIFHSAGFLAYGVPVFEIRDHGGMTDMLVRDNALGKALADTLGDKPVALLRGHGNVVVGPDVRIATHRAVYTEVNARLLATAIGLGGPITYLDPEEYRKLEGGGARIAAARAWDLWKHKVMGQ
jgi:HCOMODA/2-hydroxy-3-carboxy-muconic semialdehyde decarboxylase